MKQRPHKFITHIKTIDFYKYYKSNTTKPISSTQYGLILEDVFKELMTKVIKDAYCLTLPHKFGKLEIQKREQKITYNKDGSLNSICYKVDWGATKQHWKKVYGDLTLEQLKKIKNKPKIYCKNKYRMSFKYLKNEKGYKGQSVVMFIPSRYWCRFLKDHLKNDPYRTDYKEQK